MVGTLAAGIPESDDERIIAALSQNFHVPSNKVKTIYREQLQRLTEGARIGNFLSVLATCKTRTILRENRLKEPSNIALSRSV